MNKSDGTKLIDRLMSYNENIFLSIHSDIILIYKVGDNHRCLFLMVNCYHV